MAFPYLQDIVHALTGWNIWLPLPTFGFWVAIAALSAYTVFGRELDRRAREGEAVYANMHGKVGDFASLTLICGMIGARLFHLLEYPHDFMQDPFGMLFSRGGFTIYGGLLFGTVAGIWFVRQRHIPIRPGLDLAAPPMMLCYAIGRIGCQMSGDGDWGIPANMSLKPSWLPDWFWAQTYDGNVIGQVLPAPGVYPTPLYESLAAFVLFGVLWSLRRHRQRPGWLFALYLFLAGFERFWIEKIRVNSRYELAGLQFTQAELISTILMVAGIAGMIYCRRRSSDVKKSNPPSR
jgi:phosphatidylglycerol:prolipoprotein diacylglycerol transferase